MAGLESGRRAADVNQSGGQGTWVRAACCDSRSGTACRIDHVASRVLDRSGCGLSRKHPNHGTDLTESFVGTERGPGCMTATFCGIYVGPHRGWRGIPGTCGFREYIFKSGPCSIVLFMDCKQSARGMTNHDAWTSVGLGYHKSTVVYPNVARRCLIPSPAFDCSHREV